VYKCRYVLKFFIVAEKQESETKEAEEGAAVVAKDQTGDVQLGQEGKQVFVVFEKI